MSEELKRIHTKQVKEHLGEQIKVAGFAQTIRDQGKIKFILLRDVTGLIQIVILKSSEAFVQTDGLTTESVIEVIGQAKEESQAPGGFEVEAQSIKVLSQAHPELPIPVVVEKGGEEPELPIRLDWRWIDLRRPEKLKIFKAWTSLQKGFSHYANEHGFITTYAPSFMSTPSESGSEVFEVTYFDRHAYLAQSPQFYKQAAMASGFEKVFMIGPVFRAEPSFTTRHMTEFTGWDFEISYIQSHFDVMAEEEQMLIAGFTQLNSDLDMGLTIPTAPFPKVTFKETKQRVKAAGIVSEKENDLSPEEERKIAELVKQETGSDFVFIIDYPIEARPFYHMRYEDDLKTTKSFDLLYKGLEITTGAQREHRVDILKKQAIEKGMNLDSLKDYINFFSFGCPPHGGVGIGPGRIIMQMFNLSSVKEATFLPRDVKRLTP